MATYQDFVRREFKPPSPGKKNFPRGKNKLCQANIVPAHMDFAFNSRS